MPQKGSLELTSVYTSATVSRYAEQKRRFTRLVSAQEQQGHNEKTTKECADFCVCERENATQYQCLKLSVNYLRACGNYVGYL